jgi:hypothetical protein
MYVISHIICNHSILILSFHYAWVSIRIPSAFPARILGVSLVFDACYIFACFISLGSIIIAIFDEEIQFRVPHYAFFSTHSTSFLSWSNTLPSNLFSDTLSLIKLYGGITIYILLQVHDIRVLYIIQGDVCSGDDPMDLYVCEAEECILAAGRILGSMSWKTEPCHDFYEFACGGWSSGTDEGRQNLSRRYGQNPQLSFNTLQKHVYQQIQRESLHSFSPTPVSLCLSPLSNFKPISRFYEIRQRVHVIEGDLDVIPFNVNPIASTNPKWRTLKFLVWCKNCINERWTIKSCMMTDLHRMNK